jgi:peptidoglycan/xylan/chitin deacetylase (PgdA/CDA1 family)
MRGFHAQERLLKRAYYGVLCASRRDERLLRRHGRADRVLVLNIHSVDPTSKPFWPALHPQLFAGLLEWLRGRCTVTLPSTLGEVARTDARRPLVVLSFDDGYRDFVEHAMPILDRFGFKANQNVIGQSVETGRPPQIVQFSDFLNAAPASMLRELRVPHFSGRPVGDDPLDKERFGASIMNHLKQIPPASREPVWDELQRPMSEVEIERPTRMMSSEDVAAVAAAGHEIGAHSYSHESMEFVDDDGFLEDFKRCRRVLAAVNCDPTVYAFPNGSYRPRQLALLRELGVQHVLLVGERTSRPDASVHNRITLRGHSLPELRVRAAGLGIRRASRSEDVHAVAG